MECTEKVAVIGAGISGLACAYRLKQLGIHSRVLEASERAGGLMATVRRNGFVFESGPQCPRFPSAVWQLVQSLNLEREFVAGNPRAKRYIFRHGRLHPAPFSPVNLITTSLVGIRSKVRILTEAFRYSQPPVTEESLAEFVERKFGSDILNNLVDPIISTIFLGDADKMGMESAFPVLVDWERNQGSLVRGALQARRANRKQTDNSSSTVSTRYTGRQILRVTDSLPSLGSFRAGMGTLPERLAEQMNEKIRYKAAVASVAPLGTENGAPAAGWEIILSNREKITTKQLVLAVPAYVAAAFLEKSAPQLAMQLKRVEYAGMCTVSSVYDRSQVAHRLDGFGFMVPREEGILTICTFWNSSLFAGRAPEGRVLITSFARWGKCGNSEVTFDEKCVRTVEAENARILGITGGPVDRMIWKDPQALPQYNIGHKNKVTGIDELLRTLPNLSIIGNFLNGRSIGECVENGFRVAENLNAQRQRQYI